MYITCDLGYRAIVVENDCIEVVKLMEDPRYHKGQFVDLVFEIVKTKENFTSCSIVHVLCQENNMTNCFAKNDLIIDKDICFYDSLESI